MTKAEKQKVFSVLDELNERFDLDNDPTQDVSEQLRGAWKIANALGIGAEYMETVTDRTHVGYAYGKPVLWDGVQVVVMGTDISFAAPSYEAAVFVCKNNLAGFREEKR